MLIFEIEQKEKLQLPDYLEPRLNYDLDKARAFDQKHKRHDDNPIVDRGLDKYTLDWMLRNPNTATAWYRENLLLNPKKLVKIPGQNQEHLRIYNPEHQERIKHLANQMNKHGYDYKSPIFVLVMPDRGPVINEGNHRVHAAVRAGLSSIPVEWRWNGGSEMNLRHHPIQYI